MLGLMQDYPLLVHTIIDHAARNHGDQEIVTRSVEGPITRTTYSQLHSRSRQVAKALVAEGVKLGDRVATLAWNTARHMEVWYGSMGIGAICHTVNPRLFPEQLVYIMNHAEDKLLFVDLTFLPVIEKIQDQLSSLEKVIVLSDSAHIPENNIRNLVAYEEWLAAHDDDFAWHSFDENTAAGLCYTSGTTGNPKGVLYSHRSNVLHALMGAQADFIAPKATSVILPVVPMFHANAWALSFSAPMAGSKLVMPGALMDGASIYELLESEQVNFSAAVPTVWLMLLTYLEETGKQLPYLERVMIGGSAIPRSMMETFEQKYDVGVYHGWGMTEMSPLGSAGALKGHMMDWSYEQQTDIKLKQGRTPYLVEHKIIDDEGNELPWDGKAFGHLLVRGPGVVESYFKREGSATDDDNWFDTGDIATIDADGYIQITDRDKDVIKSGGEWISTIDIENTAVGHPEVAEAAVIGVAHPKWDERPLLIVVKQHPEKTLAKEDVLAYLDGKIAKWWMPNDVVFVEEIPHTATGKIQKMTLREQFADYQLPE